jgi:hypothetical protein
MRTRHAVVSALIALATALSAEAAQTSAGINAFGGM